MSGSFNAGGLITGLDTNNIIRQLLQLERQPILRFEARISRIGTQKDTLRDLRTQLTTLRNKLQDFKFGSIFDQFKTLSSKEEVLTAVSSGPNPAEGSFVVDVTQLASATIATSSDVLGATINSSVTLASSGISTTIEGGQFTINGVAFTVDPATQSLDTILATINASGAGVNATFDALTDKVTFVNTTPGDTSIINFGGTGDTGNFLSVLGVTNATQITGGGGTTEVSTVGHLGAINSSAVLNTFSFKGGAVTAGTFFVNGASITVDPTTESVQDIIAKINDSDAGVVASFDTSSDTIRVVSETLGSRTINFTPGTSNFLTVTNLTGATQTEGKDSQFTIDGGPVLTRNTNEVADAIGDMTLTFLSLGSSTVTISTDEDKIVEKLTEFVDGFNEAVRTIREVTAVRGSLRNDGTIRGIESFLLSKIFSQITGVTGDFQSLIDIGISTGNSFDTSAEFELKIDDDKLREAIRENKQNVEELFINGSQTGISDLLSPFLQEITGFNGSLNDRIRAGGSLDLQLKSLNEQIDRLELRIERKGARLRAQFARLEQLSSAFQVQNAFLGSLSSGFRF